MSDPQEWTPEHEDYKQIFQENNVQVIESIYPTGAVKVFRGDEEVFSSGKALGGGKTEAVNFAKGMVAEQNF